MAWNGNGQNRGRTIPQPGDGRMRKVDKSQPPKNGLRPDGSDPRPDFRGLINVGGNIVEVSAWYSAPRQGQNGMIPESFSIKANPYQIQPGDTYAQPKAGGQPQQPQQPQFFGQQQPQNGGNGYAPGPGQQGYAPPPNQGYAPGPGQPPQGQNWGAQNQGGQNWNGNQQAQPQPRGNGQPSFNQPPTAGGYGDADIPF